MTRDCLRVDMHVHSKYSTRPSQWVLQKLGCPESFTEPEFIYRRAKSLGMDLVVVTDHNTLAGSLEIAHLDGTLVSEEITAYFPDDRCKVHVLAYGIDEAIHADIQKVRENIYDLTAYLRDKGIAHVCAHPLYSVNDKLTVAHFEELLLLFRNFEVNGARDDYQNQCLRMILSELTPSAIETLENRYDRASGLSDPWVKNLIAGSDDHGAMNICRAFTEFPGIRGAADIPAAIESGQARVMGRPSKPGTMAHNLYSIAYQFYRSRFGFDKFVSRSLFLKLCDRFLNPIPVDDSGFMSRINAIIMRRNRPRGGDPIPSGAQAMLAHEAEKLIWNDSTLLSFAKTGDSGRHEIEDLLQDFVNKVSNRVIKSFADRFLDILSGGNIFDIFHSIGSAGALYAILAPYFVGYSHFTKDREVSRTLMSRLIEGGGPRERVPRVAHFTDTFHEVNGVALTLRQQLRLARKLGDDLRVLTCHPREDDLDPGVKNFLPIGVFELPEYPDQKMFYPPFPDMLDYCFREEFTHIHTATPGPIGLAALAIARLLKLPIHGTYHTAFPEYAKHLTEDPNIEDMMWRYMIWYYGQLDIVYVPSKATGDELAARGIPAEKIRQLPRGVNTERFSPAKRNGYFESRHGLMAGETRLLYVGRISREKGLPLLAEAFRDLTMHFGNLRLVVVGDGPYRTEFEEELRGMPCLFTGALDGEDLAAAYASSDLFVFPSATDTFGNVVLEAQASGLPVVVTNMGGPHENMVHGETGVIVPAGDAQALTEGVRQILADPDRLRDMGRKASAYTSARSTERAFRVAWDMYRINPQQGAESSGG